VSSNTPIVSEPTVGAAEHVSAADRTMTNSDKPTFWQRYRLPIVLGVIALTLYVSSIVWMVFGRGQV